MNPVKNNVFEPWNDANEVPMIKFENVTKKFGDFTAVDNFNLEIYEREFFALLGSSGGGKSTVLRMLAGFEQPTSGTIWLDGEEIKDIPPNERPTNMMFQSYALFPHLNVWENIAFGLKRKKPKLAATAIKSRVEEMLSLTQLEAFAKRKPDELSGGQRQRVALARSLARAPKLLLLDEPLGALDKKLRNETQFELVDIQEKTGTTFVIVTHDQEEAMTVASRIAIMNGGKVLQYGTPTEVYESPNCNYVANFIGEVNTLEGEIESVADDSLLVNYSNGSQRPIKTASPSEQYSVKDKVTYSVRPEKILVTATEEDTRENKVKGEIIDIAYLGNISAYHVKLETGQMFSAQMINFHRTEQREFTWEDQVWLSWNDSVGFVLRAE